MTPSDESAARRAALLQKAVDELANNTCLPFMKMWDSVCELESISLQWKTREADVSDDFCVELFEKTRREADQFDAFVEADLLLVRMPALPSIRAHGTVVNGRRWSFMIRRCLLKRCAEPCSPWRIHCPKSLENA